MKRAYLYIMSFTICLASGFLNSYSVYYRGGRYTFLETGNMINFINSIFSNDSFEILKSILSITCFGIGILFSFNFSKIMIKKNKKSFVIPILLVIINISVISTLFFEETKEVDISLISYSLLSFSGGLLLESFNHFIIPFTPTMMTNNYRLLLQNISLSFKSKNKTRVWFYFLVITFFLLGVILFNGYKLIFPNYIRISPIFPIFLFTILLILSCINNSKMKPFNIKNYESTFISDNNLENDEIIINHLIKYNNYKNLDLNFDIINIVDILKSKDLIKIKRNIVANKIYTIYLIENNLFEELKKYNEVLI